MNDGGFRKRYNSELDISGLKRLAKITKGEWSEPFMYDKALLLNLGLKSNMTNIQYSENPNEVDSFSSTSPM